MPGAILPLGEAGAVGWPEASGESKRQHLGRIASVMGVAWLIAVAAITRGGAAWLVGEGLPQTAGRMDPNVAAWWELSMLPEIGESLARDIERFSREARLRGRVAFRRPADLDQVRGVGPKTIQRIAKHLTFATTEPVGDAVGGQGP